MPVPNPAKDNLGVRGKAKPSFLQSQQCTSRLVFVFSFRDVEKSIRFVPQILVRGRLSRCQFPLGVREAWLNVGPHRHLRRGLLANPNALAGIEARERFRS